MTQSSSTTTSSPDADPGAALVNQMSVGPSFPEVAAVLLREALKEVYPTLNIDPHIAMVGDPDWEMVDGEILALPTRYKALSDMLAELAIQKDSTLLIEGLHFLTQQPITTPAMHLPVRIDRVGRLLNELVPAMLPAFQEQQLTFWNESNDTSGPRWHELSSTLRKVWNVEQSEDWSSTECNMARQLFANPDLEDRKAKDIYKTHAYLLDIDEVDGDEVRHLNETSLVVLIGEIESKEVILTYSILNGYEKFDSQEALGESLAAHLDTSVERKKIQWRLYEPAGNIFDHQACALIAMQIQAIGSIDLSGNSTSGNTDHPLSKPPGTEGPVVKKSPGQGWFQKQMPDWLRAASESDQTLFARHMKNLSALSSTQAGKTYLDDIPSITDYALSALKKQMQTEHADASTLDLKKVQIEVKSLVVWGTFIVPGKVETTTFSLVDLALQNLIALPLGNKTIKYQNGKPVPKWMTVDYIEKLITTVDIGRTYPALVKSKLLDDSSESTRREKLYTSQLRIQLPLLTLERKIRGQANIDERGYRYVAALMEPEETDRKVDGHTIVMRKLVFVPDFGLSTSEDVVANMFLIGPQEPDAGPCLLYRPLLDPPISQYPSLSNLLYAIRKSAPLRQSVLAWLPDGVREDYSRYTFPGPLPSPWAVVKYVANPILSYMKSGPVQLGQETLKGDFLAVLFKANTDALVELANRQSVSDSENRWETFKRAGWQIFSLTLPYLGNTAGVATWLWQIMDDLEKVTNDSDITDSQTKWEAFVDLLLNMAMAVTTHAINRARDTGSRRRTDAPEVVPDVENLPKPTLVTEKLAPLKTGELPPDHHEPIHTNGALTSNQRNRQSALKAFSTNKPTDLGQPEADGMRKGLYKHAEEWYAEVTNTWFKVTVEGDEVLIVDAKDSTRTGPLLMSNTQGQWNIDTRLRLRGSGSKGARQNVKADARRRSIELLDELNRFEAKKPQQQAALKIAYDDVTNAPGSSREAKRDVYIKALSMERTSYEAALKILIEWPVFESMPDYARSRLGYLNAQINFTFAEIDALLERFSPAVKKATDMIDSKVDVLEQQHIDDAQSMITVGDDMIERLDYMETRFGALKTLGREGFELIRQHRKALPVYKIDDLRLIQLEMYRYLCLSLDSVKTVPEGWATLEQIVDNVTVSFQSLRDAIDERSVIRLDEQISALGSLTEQFTAIEEHLKHFGEEYKDSARPEQITRLNRQIGGIKKRALRHLAHALDKRYFQRNAGNPYEPRPGPRKKFIRTRHWGIVSGEPRLSKTGKETDWVDVKNPFSKKVIVTFHHKGAGEWVAHERHGSHPAVTPALASSITKGNALIDGLAAFKTKVEEQVKQPDRTSTGIGLIMHEHATRLELVSRAIKTRLDAENVSEEEKRSAESLRTTLDKESKELHTLAIKTVLSVIKQSPPTMDNVKWLKDRGEISIEKQKNRSQIDGPRRDYLDRYQIKDLTEGQTLWFADFHYSTKWAPVHAYLSARLKTPEQIKQGTAVDTTEGLNQRQLISRYRSEIAVDQAKELFFPKQPS